MFRHLPVAQAADEEVTTALQVVSFKPVGGGNFFYLQSKLMKSPEKQVKVRVSSNTLLPSIKYRGPRLLTLMSHLGDAGYQAVARVNLSTTHRRTIVVLFPSKKGSKLPFRAVAMNADLKGFKAGSRRLINLSKFPLRGEMGAKPFKRGSSKNVKFLCQPNKMVDVPVLDPNARVLASHPVILEYYGAQKKWNILSTSRWFHTPTQRHLIFVFYDAQRKNLILRGITDTVAADHRNIEGNRVEDSEEKDDEAEKARRKKKAKGPRRNPRRSS